MNVLSRQKHLGSFSYIKSRITGGRMPNKKQKQQEREDRIQRRKEKRAERLNQQRTSSSSSEDTELGRRDNSSPLAHANGPNRDVSARVDQAEIPDLDDDISKIRVIGETLHNMAGITGVLELINGRVADAADILRPQMELRAENETLRKAINRIESAVETQRVQELTERCSELEREREDLNKLREEAEQKRLEYVAEIEKIAVAREEMEKELEERSKDIEDKFRKDLKNEEEKHQRDLNTVQKSADKLKRQNEILEKDKDKADKRAQVLEAGNETLMAKTRELKSQLEKERSRFPVQSKGIEYYKKIFGTLHQKLEKLVDDYITGPINDEQLSAMDIEVLGQEEFFKFAPTTISPVAQYLWKRGAQAYISSQLCTHIWKTFPCNQMEDFANPEKLHHALDMMSQSYAEKNTEKEGIWRNMTYEILSSFSQVSEKENIKRQEEIIMFTTKALDLIICPTQKEGFAIALADIVKEASNLWSVVKTDTCRICISRDPPHIANGEEKWTTASLKGIEQATCSEDIAIENAHTLCLFPSITAKEVSGKDPVLHPGQALFADSVAFALGNHEQQESARELARMQREWLFKQRKNSISSQGALSPQSLPSAPIRSLS